MDWGSILSGSIQQALGPTAVIYALAAIGLNVNFGYTGLLNFGQVGFAEHRGVPVASIADDITARELQRHGALVLVTEIPVGDVSEPMAIAAATSLARGATDLVAQVDLGAMVVIGGDTATAVLGDTRIPMSGASFSGHVPASAGVGSQGPLSPMWLFRTAQRSLPQQ